MRSVIARGATRQAIPNGLVFIEMSHCPALLRRRICEPACRFSEAVNPIIPHTRRFADDLTASAQVLATLRKRNSSLARFGLFQSKQHAEYFKGLVGHEQSNLEALSVTSRLHQQDA